MKEKKGAFRFTYFTDKYHEPVTSTRANLVLI